ncbi:MAG: transcriptional regulator, partial [Parvibaculum sp.]|nr:transcriptional regulator [Parvibaculum sp.]
EDAELFPGKHRNLPYREEVEMRATHQHIEPGQGIFVPIFDPHWVQNGPEVSVSFSITWHTEETLRLVKLSYINAALRKLGMPQSDEGAQPLWDGIKVAAYDVLRPVYDLVKRVVGGRRKAVALLFGRKEPAVAAG